MSEIYNSTQEAMFRSQRGHDQRTSVRPATFVGPDVAWQIAAFVFCLLFGICLSFQTMGAGDGVWFWYSSAFLNGKKLYADLHFVQQPLFVLETAFTMKLFGQGWIASKFPAVFHVLAYCIALAMLVRMSKLPDTRKAILLLCGFSVSISFGGYRFDDYHILCDCFVLYATVAILFLQRTTDNRIRLLLLAALGVCTGLALLTRLNDGGALFICVSLAMLLGLPNRRFFSFLFVAFVTFAVVFVVVQLTGDSLHDYLSYSVFKAAGSKGGIAQVLREPLMLPLIAIVWLVHNARLPIAGEASGVAILYASLAHGASGLRTTRQKSLASIGIALVLLCFHYTMQMVLTDTLLSDVTGAVAIVIFPIGLWILARSGRGVITRRQNEPHHPEEMLLLIPMGQLASGSMSSGGYFINLWQPFAVIMLLLPVCSPLRMRREWPRDMIFAMLTLVMVSTVVRRIIDPFSWHSYREKPLFTGRTIYRHPVYGPMIIDRELLEFIQPICKTLADDGSRTELLSLPFPFANYFCAVPPWHGYVQTFFDTSSSAAINELTEQVKATPPAWILYQKQSNSLRWHEILYNHGQALPHRRLYGYIEGRIAHSEWHEVDTSNYGTVPDWDSEWILIHTK